MNISDEINNVKEWNQEAGNVLHDQLHRAQNAEWSHEELSCMLKSEEDVADEYYSSGDVRHSDIREIQDAIINMYASGNA